MIVPAKIKQGDKIGIVAPARFIKPEQYEAICQFVEKQGFAPVLGDTTRLEHNIFAGSDAARTADLQQMIDNPEIRAILCVRGGYGCIRMVGGVNFRPLRRRPKWIAGFSDITVLHSALSAIGVASIHGQMPVNFTSDNTSASELFEVMQGRLPQYSFAGTDNRQGTAKADVVGGNLAVLCSIIGTQYQTDWSGKILFIEDVGEPLYRIDRMMQQLRHANLLKNLAGLVVGYFTDAEDSTPSFGMTVNEIVMDAVAGYDYPVAFGFPAGHQQPNMPLIFGRKACLTVNKDDATLNY